MSQNLPNGAGIYYEKNENLFQFQPMITDSNWSYESIRWISYMQSKPPFTTEDRQTQIQHVLNGGEKQVKYQGRFYKVDGYAEVDGIKYFLEYDGCLYHRHDCINSLRANFVQKDDTLRNKDLNALGILLQIYECDWLKEKQKLNFEIPVSRFFGRKNIKADEIMDAVVNDQFYGILRVDIKSPPSVIEHFTKLNHPPIFTHKEIEKEMVGSAMQKLLEERGAKYPLSKQLTLVFNHDQYVLTTDLAKFYISKGMELSNLTMAIEYTKSRPMANFVETVTEKRKEATRSGDQNLQNTWKLVMNASYGRLSLNLEKRRKYKFVKPSDAPTTDDNPFVTNVTPVHGEFESGLVQVTQKKKKITDRIPGILSMNQFYQKKSFFCSDLSS